MDLRGKCDCSMPDAAFYHDSDCDLWSNPDFSWGSLYWDAAAKQLRKIGPDGLTPLLSEKEKEDWEDDDWDQKWDGIIEDFTEWKEGKNTTSSVKLCRHYGEEVVFPDGTKIWASSVHDRKDDDPVPDFGCYMDTMWHPEWISFQLTWTDRRLPKVPMGQVLWMVDYLLDLARGGHVVEIGCIGGHGRTGTLMAVMALKAGAGNAEAARNFVRERYCKQAIESDVQEWYVDAVDAHLKGLPIPEQPEEACWFSEHKKLFEAGKECTKKICKTSWAKDLETFKKPAPVYDSSKICTQEEHEAKWSKGVKCWKSACKKVWESDVTYFEQKCGQLILPVKTPSGDVQQQKEKETT